MDDMRFSEDKRKKPSRDYATGRLPYEEDRDIFSDSGRDIYSGGRGQMPRSRSNVPPSYPGDTAPTTRAQSNTPPSYPGDGDEAYRPVSRPVQRPTSPPVRSDVPRHSVQRNPQRPTQSQPQQRPTQRTSQYRPNQPAHGRPAQGHPQHTAPNRGNGHNPQTHRPVAAPAHARQMPKKMGKGKKIAIAFGAIMGVLMIFTCIVFGYGYSALSGLSYTEIEDSNKYIEESTLVSDSEVRNILFIGSDARDGLDGKRSDSMILFSIDKKHKKIKLTSFMRDSYVYIPSKQYKTRLNAAYSYGGEQLLIDTIEYNFKVKIDDFVMVDYTVFEDFINLLGGLTIEDVTEAEAKYMREEVNRKSFKAGTNHVDGRTALWYCRIRYLDNDFRRTERQRKVITSIIKTAAKRNIFELIDIVEQVLPNISTNLTKSDLMSLAVGAVMSYMRYDIQQQQVPADKTWENKRINGQDVLVINLEKNQEILKEFIYEE